MKAQRADVDGVDEHLRADVESLLLEHVCSCEHHAARAASRFRYRHEAVCLDDGSDVLQGHLGNHARYGVRREELGDPRVEDFHLRRDAAKEIATAVLDGLPRDRQQLGEGADGVLVPVRADSCL